MNTLLTQTRAFVIIFCFAFCLSAQAQFVTIPDTAFVNWLTINGYSQCINGNQLDTNCPAVINTVTLKLTPYFRSNIVSLEGVQYFDALDTLLCTNHKVRNLPPLPAGLRYLDCSKNNRLTSLPTLPMGLGVLYCREDSLMWLPDLPTTLLRLDCYKNKLSALPTLPGSLLSLDCDYNAITNLPALPSSLTNLSCYANRLTVLPALPLGLDTLLCGINQITSLPALPATIVTFDCNYNPILTLPALPDSLLVLMTDNTPMTTLPALPNKLRELFCYNGMLTSLPALPATLKMLECDSNQLYSLPELPDSLVWLFCRKNPNLHCLPALKNTISVSFDTATVYCIADYGNVDTSDTRVYSEPLCDSSIQCSVVNSVSSIVPSLFTFHLSPNPASSQVTITINETLLNSTATITDLTGRRLMAVPLSTVNCQLPTSSFANGVYFITITNSEGKSATKKLVVSR